MDYHHHARLTVYGREVLCRSVVEGRLSLCEAAAEHRLSRQTAAKWVRRYREQGVGGLCDRSSRPARMRQPTSPELVARVEVLRRERWTGHRIAQQTGLSRATVSRILRRKTLSRMRDLEPRPPVQRYEHADAGDLLHLDIKKLGRIVRPSHRVTGDRRDSVDGAGWEYAHVAIDDCSRFKYVEILPDEKRYTATGFLLRALREFRRRGIHVERVLTDNGGPYRSRPFRKACRWLGIAAKRTRPYH